MNWIKHPLELLHQVLSGASKMISEPTVCLAQTVHLSWTNTNTISKWTKMRFHMTHVTLKFRQVRPKWFLWIWYVRHKPCTCLALTPTLSPQLFRSLRYVQRKSCTYLASRLAFSLNELNQASTWALSPRCTIRCIQNDLWACGTFGTNRAPILP
jgi:hypothetical protein